MLSAPLRGRSRVLDQDVRGPQCRELLTPSGSSYTPRSLLCVDEALPGHTNPGHRAQPASDGLQQALTALVGRLARVEVPEGS